MKIYRQGDIILEERKTLPKSAVLAQHQLFIKGETGNAHVLDVPVYRTVDKRFVNVLTETPFQHPQHPAINIAPGTYEVRRLRTYTETERVRDVSD